MIWSVWLLVFHLSVTPKSDVPLVPHRSSPTVWGLVDKLGENKQDVHTIDFRYIPSEQWLFVPGSFVEDEDLTEVFHLAHFKHLSKA